MNSYGVKARSRVETLRKLGIEAAYWPGISRTAAEMDQQKHIESLMASGKLDILYVRTPAVTKANFSRLLASSKRPLRLCVFRIESGNFGRSSAFTSYHLATKAAMEKHNPETMVCVMGNRTNAQDTRGQCELYGIPQSSVSVLSPIPRLDIELDARNVSRSHDKFPLVLQLLEVNQGRTVLIPPSDKACRVMASKLRAEGFDAKAVTSDGLREDPSKAQEVFNAPNRVLCATTPLAVQLKHNDIRHIIHVSFGSTAQD